LVPEQKSSGSFEPLETILCFPVLVRIEKKDWKKDWDSRKGLYFYVFFLEKKNFHFAH
jgi:hypothetical protein